jgi:hypothetical protein
MKRHRLLAIGAPLVAGAVVGVIAAGPAGALPAVDYRGGTTVTAHVTGEQPGYECQIAAHDIDGPRRVVNAAGVADLDSGPVRPGPHRVRVICEDRKRGDITTHVVGRETEVVTG